MMGTLLATQGFPVLENMRGTLLAIESFPEHRRRKDEGMSQALSAMEEN